METSYRPLPKMADAPDDGFCICLRCSAVVPNREDFMKIHSHWHDIVSAGSLGFASEVFFTPPSPAAVQQGGADADG